MGFLPRVVCGAPGCGLEAVAGRRAWAGRPAWMPLASAAGPALSQGSPCHEHGCQSLGKMAEGKNEGQLANS